ncbi:ADP-ribosylation factor GTPase-activating protein GCS1 [Astathelohania contejeani]|uniref:ADP-ribosylation factor GTPase-activating protein GCS1 n=1 Tax=Astathelohania contejeani TaxID=164912 RepID=A0ABQ7I1X4_9MICR|nr:ADP-ribosylation factor GTPase-activating protein GCS1 [Thelohania contejeani]
MTKKFNKEIKKLAKSNQTCMDCGCVSPQWASITFGIFICLECASTHRALGVTVSMVRSVNMDQWDEVGYLKMENGGNEKFTHFLEKQKLKELPIKERYKHELVREYGKELEKIVNKKKTMTEEIPLKNAETRVTNGSMVTSRVTPVVPTRVSGYNLRNHQSDDLKAKINNTLANIGEYAVAGAVIIKNHTILLGDKINQSFVIPAGAIIREKGGIIKNMWKKEEIVEPEIEIKESNIETTHKDQWSKWD